MNLLQLSKYAAACIRHNISERAGAELANALLEDKGFLTKDNPHLVIDINKKRRQKKIIGREITQEEAVTRKDLVSLYFDGREDKTIILEQDEDRSKRRRSVREEHVSLVSEPGSIFIGHVSTGRQKSALITFQEMFKYLQDNEINMTSLRALESDGTSVITGKHNEVIRLFETKFVRFAVDNFLSGLYFNIKENSWS